MAIQNIKIFSIFLALITLFSCAVTQKWTQPEKPADLTLGDYQYVKKYMAWFIHQEMKKNNTVGLSVALVDNNKIIWQQGFGYADKKSKIKATPATIYRAGSISKLFNAMATMQLVEQKKLDIDQPLVKYLPNFKIKSRFGNTDGITPRTIMTHHSGLPSDWIDNMWSKNPQSFTSVVNEIKNEYTAYPPNTILSYSNLGATLLGHAMQNVSKTPYADLISKSLLQPMAMNSSRFRPALKGQNASKSYRNGKSVIEYPLSHIPAGGLNTSVTDLSQLAMLVNNDGKINNQQIISKQSLEKMFTVQNADIPLDTGARIGLGWFIFDKILNGKERVYGHDGRTIAHLSSFLVAPESKLAVVVMANSVSASANEIATKLLQLAWNAKNGKTLLRTSATQTKINSTPEFAGIYATLLGKANIEKSANKHFVVKGSGNQFDLKPLENGKYVLRYKLFGLLPVKLPGLEDVTIYSEKISGHHVIIAETPTERMLAGVRVKPTPISKAWKQRLGQYQVLNQPEPEMFQTTNLELKIEDNFLTYYASGISGETIGHILRVINNQEAIIEGLGRGMGGTLRVVKDPQYGEILTSAGLRARKTD